MIVLSRLILTDILQFTIQKRRLSYLLKKRTKKTLLGISKKETIDSIKKCFERTEVNFYGTFAFIVPFSKYIIGTNLTAKLVNFLDKVFPFLNKYTFKFVLFSKGIKN